MQSRRLYELQLECIKEGYFIGKSYQYATSLQLIIPIVADILPNEIQGIANDIASYMHRCDIAILYFQHKLLRKFDNGVCDGGGRTGGGVSG